MGISNNGALREYKEARDRLNEIANSLSLPQTKLDEANNALQKLENDFIDKQISDVEARSQKYLEFISDMESLLDRLGRDSPADEILKLTEFVSGSADLITQVRVATGDGDSGK